jgi:hypothetical protein
MYVFYKDNGELVAVSNQKDLLPNLNTVVTEEDISPSLFYYSNGQFIKKPKLYPSDSVALNVNDSLKINSVPIGTKLHFEDLDNPYTVTEGFIEIEFINTGQWDIMVFPPFPFLGQVIKVTVE